jgi:lipopolysaccharide transport system ATP-binding protein
MSSDLAVRAVGLGKCYRIYPRPVDRLREFVSLRRQKYHTEFWALKDISFEIDRGETLGLVGPNGSGKSTLLELLCGTSTASKGQTKIQGRVAALLELGAGFNPEFTGRENVLLNAAIHGISREAIEGRFDEIFEFAGIGEFIEHPVKTYSSGMYVRLAFAAAIGMDPEILIVDEALAVGDIRFQRKCYRYFHELQSRGTTIIFVTHAVELVRAHCDRAILLNNGTIGSIGAPKDVIHDYLELMFAPDPRKRSVREDIQLPEQVSEAVTGREFKDGCIHRRSYNSDEFRWGNRRAEIRDFEIKTPKGSDPVTFERGEAIDLQMKVYFHESMESVIYGLTIRTVDGVMVFGANTRNRQIETKMRTRGETANIRFCFTLNLLPGEYFVSLGVAQDDDYVDNLAIDRRYDLVHLTVIGGPDDLGISELYMHIED